MFKLPSPFIGRTTQASSRGFFSSLAKPLLSFDEKRLKESTITHTEGHLIKQIKRNEISPPTGSIEREAEKRDWVLKIGQGQYVLKKEMTALFASFIDITKQLSDAEGFEEWIFPRLQSEEAIRNFGWLDIEHLRPELMRVTPFESDGKRLKNSFFLDPLQCPSFYRALKVMSPLPTEKLPLKVREWRGGWTYRNEKEQRLKSGFGTSLEFSGLELVYAGDKTAVLNMRFDILLQVLRMLENMGLDYRLVVGSSCSHKKEGLSPKGEQALLFEIPTIDVEVYVPQEDTYIEIGGADFIGKRLITAFGINAEDSNIQLYSGCQGVGWQRLAKAFLSQKGFDPENWPVIVREPFESFIKRDCNSAAKSSKELSPRK